MTLYSMLALKFNWLDLAHVGCQYFRLFVGIKFYHRAQQPQYVLIDISVKLDSDENIGTLLAQCTLDSGVVLKSLGILINED